MSDPSFSSDIYLEDLYAPRVLGIIDEGRIWQDSDMSLFHVAREAVGWVNWLEENDIAFTGDPYDSVCKAAEALNMDEAQLREAWERVRDDVDQRPSAHYKAGNVPCWQKVAGLNYSSFQNRCPEELRQEVADALEAHRQKYPDAQPVASRRPESFQGTPETQNQVTSSSKTVTPPQLKHPPKQTHPVAAGSAQHPESTSTPSSPISNEQAERDRKLAELARNVLNIAGQQGDLQHSFEGQSNYRITLDLDTNTLRVFARDRGELPILLDANGQIDHSNSKVLPQDIKAFETALALMRAHQQQKAPALEMGR